MLRISPFTPLFFSPSTDDSGLGCRYEQTFAVTDHILIELIGKTDDAKPKVSIINHISGREYELVLSDYKFNSEDVLYFYILTSLMPGYYTIVIDGKLSEIFKVTDNEEELSETVLVQYSMRDDKQRNDCKWYINGCQQFFDFRVPGGFKDNGWGFSVETEQFVTHQNDIISLYARETTSKTFTIGTQIGCPIWFAELLNRLLCCDYVYFDGIRYSRKDTSVPEPAEQYEGSRSFVFKQILQRVVNLEPTLEAAHQLMIRRVDDVAYRTVGSQPLKLNV